MSRNAFVYTEVPVSIPFDQAPWRQLNPTLAAQPGFLNKTWLSGAVNKSVGGFYQFDSLENARRFVTDYFPTETAALGVPHTALVFDASVVVDASRDLNSLHFGGTWKQNPGAFVFDDIQVTTPFSQVPWRDLNRILRDQPGLLHKTWLSGVNGTTGGFYAFDTLDNAARFATQFFPPLARKMNAGYTLRIFDASVVVEASKALRSPFFR
jgi:hypothetical protein